MRQQAIKAVREELRAAGSECGCCSQAEHDHSFSVIARFANGGQNALLAKPIPGHPQKISVGKRSDEIHCMTGENALAIGKIKQLSLRRSNIRV